MNCLYTNIKNKTCYKIVLEDCTDIKGTILSSKVNVLIPGQTKSTELKFNVGSLTYIDSINTKLQKLINNPLMELPTGMYTFDIEIVFSNEKKEIETIKEQFCFFNFCNIKCIIDQLKLDIVLDKCKKESNTDCSSTKDYNLDLISTIDMYIEGIKASAELCKMETVNKLYTCLKSKLDILENEGCNNCK